MKHRLSNCDKWHLGEPSDIRKFWANDYRRTQNPYPRFECRKCAAVRHRLGRLGQLKKPVPKVTTYGVIPLNWKAPNGC